MAETKKLDAIQLEMLKQVDNLMIDGAWSKQKDLAVVNN